MAILAQHSYTIRRLIDGKTLNFVLQSNQALTQIYTPDPATYVPNYPSSPFLVITPSLMISGESGDQIGLLKTAPTWKVNDSTVLTSVGGTTSAASPFALTIKNNMTAISQMKVECTGIYVQPGTLAEIAVTASMTFTKVTNSGASIIAIASAPNGTIFKNNLVTSLTAKCELWRGSTIDNTNVTYAWYKQISGVWTLLTAGNAAGVTGFTTDTITIPSSSIINYGSFRCDVTDTDSGSSTYNKVVKDYISFADMSDPYSLAIEYPKGDGVISGGSTTVKVHAYQGASRMEDAFFTGKTIKHFRYNAAGVLDTTWGTAGYKTGRELTITYADLLVGGSTAFGVQMEA